MDATEALTEIRKAPALSCDFCGKGTGEVFFLFAGPSVFVCDECVDLCNGIIAEQKAKRAHDSGAA